MKIFEDELCRHSVIENTDKVKIFKAVLEENIINWYIVNRNFADDWPK